MTGDDNKPVSKRDWRISLVLLSVWLFALVMIISRENRIPASMLVVSSIFFVLLLPAMNDLVQSIERMVAGNGSRDSDAREKD